MGLCSSLCQTLVQYIWPNEWSASTIMAKELVPIVLGCAVWGPLLAKKSTVFQCDSQDLMQAINKGFSRDLMVMHLLSCLWFFTAFFDIQIMATHIPGAANNSADTLSRNLATQSLTHSSSGLTHTNATTSTSSAHCLTIETGLDFLFLFKALKKITCTDSLPSGPEFVTR